MKKNMAKIEEVSEIIAAMILKREEQCNFLGIFLSYELSAMFALK